MLKGTLPSDYYYITDYGANSPTFCLLADDTKRVKMSEDEQSWWEVCSNSGRFLGSPSEREQWHRDETVYRIQPDKCVQSMWSSSSPAFTDPSPVFYNLKFNVCLAVQSSHRPTTKVLFFNGFLVIQSGHRPTTKVLLFNGFLAT